MTTPIPHGWLVVQCKGGWEERTRAELAKQGFETWLPWLLCNRLNRGTQTIRKEPLIPGYAFVAHIDIGPAKVDRIRRTVGVLDVVGMAGAVEWTPALLGHPLVLDLIKRCNDLNAQTQRLFDARKGKRHFEPGTEAEVIAGPFQGRRGIVARLFVVSPQQRVTLLLDICGGRVPVSIEAAHVAETATIMGGASVSSGSPAPLPPAVSRPHKRKRARG